MAFKRIGSILVDSDPKLSRSDFGQAGGNTRPRPADRARTIAAFKRLEKTGTRVPGFGIREEQKRRTRKGTVVAAATTKGTTDGVSSSLCLVSDPVGLGVPISGELLPVGGNGSTGVENRDTGKDKRHRPRKTEEGQFLMGLRPQQLRAMEIEHEISVDGLTWATVHGCLLLALRHPGYTGPSRMVAQDFAGRLGAHLVEWGILTEEELTAAAQVEAEESPHGD